MRPRRDPPPGTAATGEGRGGQDRAGRPPLPSGAARGCGEARCPAAGPGRRSCSGGRDAGAAACVRREEAVPGQRAGTGGTEPRRDGAPAGAAKRGRGGDTLPPLPQGPAAAAGGWCPLGPRLRPRRGSGMAGGRGASVPAALLLLALLLAASRPAVAGRAARGAPPWREAPLAYGPGGRKAPAPGRGKGAARPLTDRQPPGAVGRAAPGSGPGVPLPGCGEARLSAEEGFPPAAPRRGSPLPRPGGGRRGGERRGPRSPGRQRVRPGSSRSPSAWGGGTGWLRAARGAAALRRSAGSAESRPAGGRDGGHVCGGAAVPFREREGRQPVSAGLSLPLLRGRCWG